MPAANIAFEIAWLNFGAISYKSFLSFSFGIRNKAYRYDLKQGGG
jgi:hypothetical protein